MLVLRVLRGEYALLLGGEVKIAGSYKDMIERFSRMTMRVVLEDDEEYNKNEWTTKIDCQSY